MKLRGLGENQLLARLLPKLTTNDSVVVGAGDDCAVVASSSGQQFQLLKTDCIVEGIHFAKEAPPKFIGWKAMARPLSDFAAMSGIPQFALITIIIPGERTLHWVQGIYRGLAEAALLFDVAIVGGETSNTQGPAVISVSVSGFAEKDRWVTRAGGKVADELFVTGRLGGSLRGRHLKFTPRIEESRWLTKHFPIHAMMDLSDGLGSDLPRLARASNVGFAVDENALPRHRGCSAAQAISDGEDYELLFAIAPSHSARLQKTWPKKFQKLLLTRIGCLSRKSQITNRKWKGYVHFQ
ncbi:MAG: thiamine-phosphate kinase [Verrucomicrobiota bacterium]